MWHLYVNIGNITIDAIIRIKRRLLLTDKIIVYKTLIKYGYRYTQNVLFKQGEMPWYRWIFCEYGKTRGDCVLDDIGDWDKKGNLAHWKVSNKYTRNQPWNNTYSMYGSVYNLFKSLLKNFS